MTDLDLREPLLRAALRIRLVEERIIALYPSDRIQSPVHLSIGQEAVAVGVCDGAAADRPRVRHLSEPRLLPRQGRASSTRLFAELYGRRGGCARRQGGSMHLAAPEVGFMGSSAIVASTIPHAVGAALAAERRGKDQIVVAVFGDGATEEGVYHESLNFAALHRLPVLFLCENNGLAVHCHSAGAPGLRSRPHAAAFGIPSRGVAEGRDPMAVTAVRRSTPGRVRAGAPLRRSRHLPLQGACRRRRGLPLRLPPREESRRLEGVRPAARRHEVGRGASTPRSSARSTRRRFRRSQSRARPRRAC